jgi:hypothetical protein
MTSALLLDELKEAGLLFEADPQMTDHRRDWLRPLDNAGHTLETADEWAAELVASFNAVDR